MKKFGKKPIVLLITVVMLLTFTVSGTVAFLADNSGPVVNEFIPTSVDITVTDTVQDHVKKNPTITNKSQIPVFIRVAVVGYWVNDAGNIVAPWENNIVVDNERWTYINGYYYYNGKVAAGSSVVLFTEYKQPDPPPVAGAHLEMEIIAQAIQADGMGANSAQEAFAVAATDGSGT